MFQHQLEHSFSTLYQNKAKKKFVKLSDLRFSSNPEPIQRASFNFFGVLTVLYLEKGLCKKCDISKYHITKHLKIFEYI